MPKTIVCQVCALILLAGSVAAQNTNQPDKSALIQELQSMKKRIEQLETQLKAGQTPVVSNEAAGPADTRDGSVLPNINPANTFGSRSPPIVSKLAVSAADPKLTTPADTPAPTPVVDSQQSAQLQQKQPPSEPFAFADFTWLTGNPRNTDNPGETSFFTPEIRADVDYVYDYNHPADHTIGGSSEVFRAGEVQVMQLGVAVGETVSRSRFGVVRLVLCAASVESSRERPRSPMRDVRTILRSLAMLRPSR
jgi:hypothetical protein